MSVAALMLSLPVALGGESTGHESTGLAVISLVSIVLGYLLIAGLWYFVFSEKARSRRKRGPSD
jgi:hypothetical protein